MSTKNGLNLSKRIDSMMLMLALIVGLAAGIVVQQITDGAWYVFILVTMVVVGLYFLVTTPFANNESDFIPSQRSFKLVWGVLLLTVGALLLVNVYATMEMWMAVVILLLAAAVLVLYFFFMTKRD